MMLCKIGFNTLTSNHCQDFIASKKKFLAFFFLTKNFAL